MFHCFGLLIEKTQPCVIQVFYAMKSNQIKIKS